MPTLSIAGYDPSAGAGILADIKTFTALKTYGTGVITALTAQNPNKVVDIKPIDPRFIEEEIDLILDYLDIEYAKTGMLYSEDIIRSVIKKTKEYELKLIVDPVMIAGSGGVLQKEEIVNSFKKLLKVSILTTPNVYEAEVLSGKKIGNLDDSIEASKKISDLCNVVITGGHLEGDSVYNSSDDLMIIKEKIIDTTNTHGSGCSFSAAITAYLSQGKPMKDAILSANKFTKISIEDGKYDTLDQFGNLEY